MTRHGRSSKRMHDERFYPVRLRVELPSGRNQQFMAQIYDWLKLHAPRAHALHSTLLPGDDRVVEALEVFLEDPALAVALVSELHLDLAFGKTPAIR